MAYYGVELAASRANGAEREVIPTGLPKVPVLCASLAVLALAIER